MAIGDGGGLGGMNLNVGIGVNVTGMEQLAEISKMLQLVEEIAMLTGQTFRNMASEIDSSFRNINAGASRTAAEMQNFSRAMSSAAPSTGIITAMQARSTQMSARPAMAAPATGIIERMQAESFRRAADKIRLEKENERTIQEEISARQKSIETLKTGLLGGLGISAAFQVANMARRAVEAVSDMSQKQASLRLAGYSEAQITDLRNKSFAANVPGSSAAANMSAFQQIGAITGPQGATPDIMRALQIGTNALMTETGREDRQAVQLALLRFTQARGPVNQKNMLSALQDMLLQGRDVSLEALVNSAQQGQTFNRTFDINNNPRLRATEAALNERFQGRGGTYFNEALTEVYGQLGHPGSPFAAALMQQGRLGSQLVPYPRITAGGGASAGLRQMGPAIAGVDPNNPIAMINAVIDVVKRDLQIHGRPPEEFQQDLQRLMGGKVDVPRIFSVMGSEDFQKEVAAMMERLKTMSQSFAEVNEKGKTLEGGLQAVRAGFDSIFQAFTGGNMIQSLYRFGESLQNIGNFLNQHQGFTQFITTVTETIAAIVALRIAISLLGRAAMMAGLSSRTGAVASGAVAGAAGFVPVARAEAGAAAAARTGGARTIGGTLSEMPSVIAAGGGIKNALSTFAMRGTAGLIVGGIVSAIADQFFSEDIAAIAKDAAMGGTIGGMMGGIPGAIIGAISNAVLQAAIKYGGIQNPPKPREELTPQERRDQDTARFKRAQEELDRQTKKPAEQFGPPEAPKPFSLLNFDPFGTQADRDARIAERRREAEEQRKADELKLPTYDPMVPFNARPDDARAFIDKQREIISDQTRRESMLRHNETERAFENTPAAAAIAQPAPAPPRIGHPMRVLEPVNKMVPQPGVVQTDTTSPLALALRKQNDEQRTGMPSSLPALPTGNVGPGRIPLGSPASMIPQTVPVPTGALATPEVPSVGQAATPAPSSNMTVNTITAGTLIVGSTGGIASEEAGRGGSRGGLGSSHHGSLASGFGGVRTPIGAHGSVASNLPISAPSGAIAPRGLARSGAPLTADTSMSPAKKTLLDTLAGGEAGKMGYLAQNPGSTAHGRLQFINSTDREVSQKTGLFGNDPISQDKKGWFLASTTYQRNTGRDLETDVKDPRNDALIAQGLKGVWPSLPGGSQQNTSMETFRQRLQSGRDLYANEGIMAASAPPPGMMQHIQSERAFTPPNVQGPQVSPEQGGDVPSNKMTVNIHSQHLLDGDPIADSMMQHIIGGGPTSAASTTGFDPRMMPLMPGVSVPPW